MTSEELYKGHSFLKLKESVIQDLNKIYKNTERYVTLLELINPYDANWKSLYEQIHQIQIRYFAHHAAVLTNEMFDNIVNKSNSDNLFSFEFGIKHQCSIFGIPSSIDPITLEIAESRLQIIIIKKDCGFAEKMELSPIISSGVKIHCISANGKSETHTVRRTIQYHEDLAKMQHKRGYGMEKILSLQYAQQLFEKNQNEFVKEIIHQIEDLKDLDIPERIDLETLSEILQVSIKIGEGLAYDVLQPVFDVNDKLKAFNLVEVKYSQNDSSIHLSENEREKILNFAQKDIKNWRLYHFVNGQNYDRTEVVLEAVKTHAENYKEEQLLIGVDWMINFEN